MKANALIPWILAGGLAASTLCNVLLLQRVDEIEARLTEPARASDALIALPSLIVSKLQLTATQCDRIIDCSVH